MFGREPKPAEFPLLRKVPLTSAVSEILTFFLIRGRSVLYRSLRKVERQLECGSGGDL